MNNYNDIINLNRPKSKHPKMSLYDRAAQFAPFAALTTYGEAINEAKRLTDKKIELSDEEINEINIKLEKINSHIKNKPNIKITYFLKDSKKEGGSYRTKENKVKKIDVYNKEIIFIDNTKININNIIYIDL